MYSKSVGGCGSISVTFYMSAPPSLCLLQQPVSLEVYKSSLQTTICFLVWMHWCNCHRDGEGNMQLHSIIGSKRSVFQVWDMKWWTGPKKEISVRKMLTSKDSRALWEASVSFSKCFQLPIAGDQVQLWWLCTVNERDCVRVQQTTEARWTVRRM